jgi:hypothetical protein
MNTEATVSQLQGVDSAPVSTEQEFDKVVAELTASPDSNFSANYLDVKLFQDYVEIDMGTQGKKSLSYPDFRHILGNVVHEQVKEDLPGILPPSNMIFFSQNSKEIRLSCYYPSSIRPLLYNGMKMEIVAPNMIISHVLRRDGKDWVTYSSKYFCTDNPINKLPKTFIDDVDHNRRIFLSALSNTYAEARMCTGGNHMPARFKDDNLRGLDWYYKFLWESPFNDDLGIAAVRGMYVSDWYNILSQAAKDGKSYPYEKLSGWTKHPDGLIPAAPLR